MMSASRAGLGVVASGKHARGGGCVPSCYTVLSPCYRHGNGRWSSFERIAAPLHLGGRSVSGEGKCARARVLSCIPRRILLHGLPVDSLLPWRVRGRIMSVLCTVPVSGKHPWVHASSAGPGTRDVGYKGEEGVEACAGDRTGRGGGD
jgi:hypothetical protein